MSLAVKNTAFPTADDSTEFGLFAAVEQLNTILNTNMLSKVSVNNNASATYQVPNDTGYVLFTGTNVASLTVNLPAAPDSQDGQEVTVFGAAAVTTLAFASIGATVVGTSSSSASTNWRVKFKYDAATLSWYAVGN